MQPTVFLIGAGPGDPQLMTLRGLRCLQQADVVLYDGLSNVELLEFAPQAEHVCVGKHGQSRIWKQSEIIKEMFRHARQGKRVARLKGGDPAVFARTAEEVDALVAAKIPFEIVPGITAALAAGSYAGIPITHRKMASAVALVTGHEEPGKDQSALDWPALAAFPGTLVVYMGVTKAKLWTDALIAAGKDPATPAALIRRCSHPDQTTIHCRLDEIADRLTPASKFRPPVIAIVGPVATLGETMTWVQNRPLHGQTILVTRPADQAASLAQAIRERGGHPLVAPAIAVRPVDDPAPLERAIASLEETDLLIFCSTNGVEHFFARLLDSGRDARALASTRLAVVGRKTAAALKGYGIRVDVVPEDFRATALVDCVADRIAGQRVTILRASRGSDELPRKLKALGAQVREVVAYQNVDVSEPDPRVLAALREHRLDWVTVTSSATADNLVRLYGDSLRQARIAALSPVTADALRRHGLAVDAVAQPYTIEALLDAIAKAR